MKKHIPLLACWIVNTVILYILSGLFPKSIVLGNGWVSPLISAFLIGLMVVVLDHLAKHVNKFRLHLKTKYQMGVLYLIINILAFWLLARIPFIFGYGISRFYWAIVLGTIVTLAQWTVRQVLKKRKLI